MDINQASEQFIRLLTDQFIASMTSQIRDRVVNDVSNHIAAFNVDAIIREKIDQTVDNQIRAFYWPDTPPPPSGPGDNNIGSSVINQFSGRTEEFIRELGRQIRETAISDVRNLLGSVNVDETIRREVNDQVSRNITNYNFPVNSIPGRSVESSSLTVSADNITAGTFRNFESTGIQDKASGCQVTILDSHTVFENTLVAARLDIAGDAKISGNVNIDFIDRVADRTVARITDQYNQGTFDQYCDRVFEKIDQQGLDSIKVRVNGQAIVTDGRLADTVTSSNLQRLGALRELQVIGETVLDETVYVSSKRMGINTMDPERALDIWDQEVQIVIGKQQRDTAFFGTTKNQKIVIGTAGREQLSINPDGTVSASFMKINQVVHTSSAQQPIDNRPAGQIVWNEQPIIGSPIGWVSLGGARWARFGTITE